MNKHDLIKQLNDLGNWETNNFKKISYFQAARIIEKMYDDEFIKRQDFKDIKGIGDAINKKILQFKETGYIEKWKNILKK